MQLGAILLARVIGFIDTNDLNPTGKAFFPALVPLLVERYGFQTYPKTPQEFDEEKGVAFQMGHTGQTTLDKIQIWTNGISVDVRSSTKEAADILESALLWLSEVGGLKYEKGQIKRWGYLSNLTFYSDIDFQKVNPAVIKLGERVSQSVAHNQRKNLDYKMAGITVDFDRWATPNQISAFTIQRRADTPFTEKKYFSAAPLPTDKHIEVLQLFEEEWQAYEN
jgi:hypothetical protein